MHRKPGRWARAVRPLDPWYATAIVVFWVSVGLTIVVLCRN